MKLLLTTNPGIEDIVKKEIEENFTAKFSRFMNLQGRVLVETGKKNLKKVFNLHSIYHIIKFVSQFEISPTQKGLKQIYEKLKKLYIEELENSKTFRVTSQRIGEHDFTSIQVQKFAGQAIVDKYNKKVDLKNFDVNVICDVIGSKCFVGVQLTKESLHKRFKRIFNHPAAIKAPLAYAMLRLAEIKKNDILLDPFCGGGTIPIEAALVYNGKINIYASDINEKFLKGAKQNAKSAKVGKYIKFKIANARKLNKFYNIKIDKIVTNPPYGVRMSKRKNLKSLYLDFLNSVEKILSEDGKIVMINLKATSFRTIVFRTKKFKITHERVVESGGLYPHIFVLEKLHN
jgi:23S rRNA G2445 N2-methylase RlmL